MNFAKRAFAYISRKKGKTISLFLLVFVVAVFLISCFEVLSAAEKLEKDIRTSLGASFYIRANTEVSMNEKGEAEVRENSVHITGKEIDEIMQTGEIKYCNPINYGFAKSDGIQFIPGDKHTEGNNMGKVTALRFSALAPDFTDETAVLTKGKHITEADKGKILISEQLANENLLSVGDFVILTHAKLGEADGQYIDEISVKTAYVKVQVSGIYKLNVRDTSVRPTAGIAENEIYGSLDVLDELQESERGVYTGEVRFYVMDPACLNDIIRNVRELQSIDWTTHFIRANDFRYSRIAERVSSLGGLTKILITFVSAVSAAILTLLLTMRMRDRMQEAGILLSVGIPKRQIMAGFLLEVLSVAAVALLLSYVVSFGVASFLEYKIFSGLRPNLLRDEALMTGMGTDVQPFNYLKLSGIETAFIYLCQFMVIAASTCLSSIRLTSLEPKEILVKIG